MTTASSPTQASPTKEELENILSATQQKGRDMLSSDKGFARRFEPVLTPYQVALIEGLRRPGVDLYSSFMQTLDGLKHK